jgi:2-enoate reductase
MAAAVGIDGIEIHGHEGYLIDQFVTKIWNKRDDKYGGDLKNRLTFPIEIIQNIKDAVGKDFPLIYRFGVKHFIRDPTTGNELGRDISESIEIAQCLEELGVDALDLDAGCYESMYWAHPPTYMPHGCYVDMVARVKKTVRIPVIVAGRIDIPELAEKVLEEGKADIISLGRSLLADPYWPKKAREGKVEDIRPCIGCHEGCVHRVANGRPLSCSVNPSCGRERLYELKPATKPKRVKIAGGGVAGMEAARVLAIRGHKVTLYEKTDRLGGHLIEASVPEFKEDIQRLLMWYITQIKKLRIKVKFDTEFTPKSVMKERADVVIVATGSAPLIPEISSREKGPMILTCCDLLSDKKKTGDRIVMLGGGLVGCETALWLATQGKNVTVVECEDNVMRDIFDANRQFLLDKLTENKVEILTNTSVQDVVKGGVIIIDKNSNRKMIPCDTVVFAVGFKPERKLYGSLANKVEELYEIGDCKQPRKIHDAIWDGFIVGLTI